MPQLIERGYLYIAQPPLYKVKRGTSEVYLKDNAAFERYIIETALDNALLTSASGVARAGAELVEIVSHANQFAKYSEALSRLVDKRFIQAAALAGLCGSANLSDESTFAAKAADVARWLNLKETERTLWTSEAKGKAVQCSRRVRGVSELVLIPDLALRAPEAEKLATLSETLRDIFNEALTLDSRKESFRVTTPLELMEAVMEAGRKGATVSRFKGLGEMNADQLWETTLDPEARTLLQVSVRQAEEAG